MKPKTLSGVSEMMRAGIEAAMKTLLVAIIAGIVAVSGAGAAHANPNVPWVGGSCDAGDPTQVVMTRYQGSVFVCVPPGFWHRTGGIR